MSFCPVTTMPATCSCCRAQEKGLVLSFSKPCTMQKPAWGRQRAEFPRWLKTGRRDFLPSLLALTVLCSALLGCSVMARKGTQWVGVAGRGWSESSPMTSSEQEWKWCYVKPFQQYHRRKSVESADSISCE